MLVLWAAILTAVVWLIFKNLKSALEAKDRHEPIPGPPGISSVVSLRQIQIR